jgi:hypothetical protein
MKRQAGLLGDEEEDEEEEESDEDEDDQEISNTVDNLNVFCVSALEYLKLKNKLPTEDGEAQVGLYVTVMATIINIIYRKIHVLSMIVLALIY